MKARTLTAALLAAPLLLGSTAAVAGAAPSSAPAAATSSASARPAAAKFYSIQTRTSNIPGAGTDGDIWVRVNGTNGSSNWLYLDTPGDNFERNQLDSFGFWMHDYGYIRSVDVYFNRSGLWADWHLAYVRVNGTLFPANRWFTKSGTQVRLYRA